MREVDGKVAVVTGAANGMGLAFAQRFAREGMKVMLADYEADALDLAVQRLRPGDFDVEGVVADVSSQAALEDLAERTFELYDGCHVLCNNAGVVADSDLGAIVQGVGSLPTWEQPLDDWHWTFNVNFWGVVHGIRAFVPRMLERGEEGHIVNTASIAGLVSGVGLQIYGSSKHGVVRVSEALFGQLGGVDAPIGVSVLCPGGVKTRIGFAERNRPDDLGSGLSEEELAAREEAFNARGAETGMEPDAVAEIVFQAIQDDQFWIVTHPEYDEAIRIRADEILARRNPSPRAF